jgi:hypothetical protein
MKLLYLSCHAVLEYDELKLFEELGIEYFSLGSYIDPRNPVDPIRPALTRTPDPELYHSAPDRNSIPKEFFDKFDVIVVMHIPEWITNNWENMKHKRVIWRTIGQSTEAIESLLKPYVAQGLEIVRYSPTEARIPGFAGESAIIRFYKDPEEFKNWTGEEKEVITFAQNMKTRGEFCHFDLFEQSTSGLNAHVYGPKNDDAGLLNGGFLTYDQMKEKYRKGRVYFYSGTQPAAYTLNFMEAWMTGIPVVAIGANLANSLNIIGESYEVEELIGQDKKAGFVAHDIEGLKHYINTLYEVPEMGRIVGENGRARAIELFGKENIKEDWKRYLNV